MDHTQHPDRTRAHRSRSALLAVGLTIIGGGLAAAPGIGEAGRTPGLCVLTGATAGTARAVTALPPECRPSTR